MRRNVLRESGDYRRLLEEQLEVIAVLGSGKKSDAMWHVPQRHCYHDVRGIIIVLLLLTMFKNNIKPTMHRIRIKKIE